MTPGDTETGFQVRSFDADMPIETYRLLPKLPLHFVLDNLRSAFNVGAIFRTCDILRVKGLWLCGYTPYPPNKKLEKTSLGTTAYVPWHHTDSVAEAIGTLKSQGVAVWAAETTSRSVSYLKPTYPSELAVVLGNETYGISPEVVERCDLVIEIPTFGFKNSLNVASACAVLGFAFMERVGIPLEGGSRKDEVEG